MSMIISFHFFLKIFILVLFVEKKTCHIIVDSISLWFSSSHAFHFKLADFSSLLENECLLFDGCDCYMEDKRRQQNRYSSKYFSQKTYNFGIMILSSLKYFAHSSLFGCFVIIARNSENKNTQKQKVNDYLCVDLSFCVNRK